MRPQPLPERLARRSLFQFAGQLGVCAEGEVRLRPPFHRRGPQLLQPRRLGAGERRVGQLAVGWPAPQRQGFPRPWVLGADGRRPTVARALGLTAARQLAGDMSLLFAYWTGFPGWPLVRAGSPCAVAH